MALPKISHAVFITDIPSLKEKKTFRPFTVKEEKLLMLASSAEETDPNDAIESIKQVINNCAVDEINVDELALFDIEWLFIQLRINSVGSDIELSMVEDDIEWNGQLNLKDIKVTTDDSHDDQIILDEKNNIGVVMSYPTIDTIQMLSSDNNSIDSSFKAFSSCIVKLFDNDKVFTRGDDFDERELQEFIESLPGNAVGKFSKFFDTMPKISHEIILFNKDGDEKKFTLNGIKDFF